MTGSWEESALDATRVILRMQVSTGNAKGESEGLMRARF